MTDKEAYIRESRAKFDAYDTLFWTKEYFDEISGGYIVFHKEHQFSKAGGGAEGEKKVGKMIAINSGKHMEFLPEGKKKVLM